MRIRKKKRHEWIRKWLQWTDLIHQKISRCTSLERENTRVVRAEWIKLDARRYIGSIILVLCALSSSPITTKLLYPYCLFFIVWCKCLEHLILLVAPAMMIISRGKASLQCPLDDNCCGTLPCWKYRGRTFAKVNKKMVNFGIYSNHVSWSFLCYNISFQISKIWSSFFFFTRLSLGQRHWPLCTGFIPLFLHLDIAPTGGTESQMRGDFALPILVPFRFFKVIFM